MPAAPPPATMVLSRGSMPSLIVTSLIARIIRSVARPRMRKAVSSIDRAICGGDGAHRPPGGIDIERHLTAEKIIWIEVAQHHRGIGHRGLGSAAPVTSRPGHGAGRRRTDAHQAAIVDPGDGPATGADRAHVHRGNAEKVARVTRTEPGVPAEGRRPSRTTPTSNVVPPVSQTMTSSPRPSMSGIGYAGNRRHGRARTNRVDRLLDQSLDRAASPARGADQDLAAVSGMAKVAFEFAQMSAASVASAMHRSRWRRLGDIRARSGDQLMRERIGHARQHLFDQLADRYFVERD